MASETAPAPNRERRRELFAFVFLAILIWPFIAVGVVGGFGFAVWIYQMIAGPPGPPDYPV